MIAWLAGKLAHKLAPFFVVVLLLGLIGAAGGWGVTAFKLQTARLEKSKAETALARALAEHTAFLAKAAEFARKVAEIERKRDEEHRKRLMEIEDERKRADAEADEREQKLAADYRAGLVRVRAEVCSGPRSVPRTSAPPGVGKAAAPAREHPAIAAVRTGATADAEIRQCRAYVVAQAERCPLRH